MITQEFLDFLDEKIETLEMLRRVEVESGPLTTETTPVSLRMLETIGQDLVKFSHSDPPKSPFS